MDDSQSQTYEIHSQAPALPRTVLFEPILTTVSPVMVPEMITMAAVLPVTAEVRASKVVTVVVAPPFPPVVLENALLEYQPRNEVNMGMR